jgi:hypothetical protein
MRARLCGGIKNLLKIAKLSLILWSYKWFRSCNRKSVILRDLILMEVSALDGIVLFIIESIYK